MAEICQDPSSICEIEIGDRPRCRGLSVPEGDRRQATAMLTRRSDLRYSWHSQYNAISHGSPDDWTGWARHPFLGPLSYVVPQYRQGR
jgi:hypothetical protein